MMNTGALRIVALFVALVFTSTAAFANGSAAEAVVPGIEEASARRGQECREVFPCGGGSPRS